MPQQIAGAAPFQGGGGGMFSGGVGGLGASYNNAYNAALKFNQGNYNSILSGYQTALQNQVGSENEIGRGYTDLSNRVLGDLHRAGTTQRQANADEYARVSGLMANQMIDRGLGNTTVQQSMQRGLEFDRSKANNALAESIGNMTAGYRSNLGQAGLGFRERAMGMNSGLQQNQLNWMNSVNAPYPSASAYANMAQMYGATDQANKNRQMMMGMMGGGGSGGGGYMAQPAYGTGGGATGRPMGDWAYGSSGGYGDVGGVGNGWGSGSGMSMSQMGFGAPQGADWTQAYQGGSTLDYSPGSYGDMWGDSPGGNYGGGGDF